MLERKKRVLLLGASGYLGTQLMAVLNQDLDLEITGTSCTSSAIKNLVHLDVTEAEPFVILLNSFRPDVIIWAMMSGQKERLLIENGLGVLLSWMTGCHCQRSILCLAMSRLSGRVNPGFALVTTTI